MVGSRVYVGGLPYGCRERDLERFFKGYGRTRDILLKNGYGFIEFDDYRDADDAVYELNGKELLGERVSVEKARGTPRGSDVWRGRAHQHPPPPRRRARNREPEFRSSDRYGPPTRTDYRLIVENLSSRVSWQDLKDYMRQAGEVTYADAHKDRRNEGVVEFATLSDMKNALDKLDDTDLNGRRIKLVEDRRRTRRSRSSSSRSRSRSRSRRRSRSSRRSSRSRSRRSSRSKSRAKSGSRSKSRSKSHDRKSKSRSRSKSQDKKMSKSRSRSVDKRDDSMDRSGSKDKSKSRSRSVEKNGDQSPDPKDD
ncbi:serine-arginine protein 55 isoform X5 [Cimex lectularius]|uniref:RRM domain-containing protein n=1 Tax=Cimex lectularius TaxID=79782 RepID=A0A8I6SUB2_CIMLE|nr:serine-arginine protein 55 isoform X5 [Cimex lectularius]